MCKMLKLPLTNLIFSAVVSITSYGTETAEFALEFGGQQPLGMCFKTIDDFNRAYKGDTTMGDTTYAQFRGRYIPLTLGLSFMPSQSMPVTALIKEEDYKKLQQHIVKLKEGGFTSEECHKFFQMSGMEHRTTTFQSQSRNGSNFTVTFPTQYTLIPIKLIGDDMLEIPMNLKEGD